jgi:hypothetical protein
MTYEIPTNEPQEIVKGDRWQWKRSLTDYPASTWTLSYSMHRLHATAAKISITAGADGDTHSVDVAAATTAAYTDGDYEWFAFVTDGTTRRLVDEGTIKVHADLEADAAVDRRGHWRIVLDAVQAVLQDRATKDQMAYSIAGRSISRMPVEDLIALESKAQAKVNSAERRDRSKNGLGHRLSLIHI